MNQFHGAWMALLQIDTRYTTIIYLTEEFAEVGAALVPHPCLWEQLWLIASLNDTVGEIDILAKAHLRKSTQLLVDITADAHIKGAWEELVELFLAATNATRGKERRHGIADGLLHWSKGGMGCVGTAETLNIEH